MSVKMLSRNKEIRDLIRVARSQNWIVQKLQNNHLRWIPPRGPFVHSSAMINHQGVLSKIRHDLEKAGLQLDTIYVERPKPVEQPPPEPVVESQQPQLPLTLPEPVVQELQSTEPPPVEIEEMPRKPSGRGQTQAAVIAYLKKRYPTNLTNDQIYEGVGIAGLKTTRGSVAQTTYTLEKKGILTKVRKGVYKFNADSVDAKPEVEAKTAKKISAVAAASSDAEALKQAMDKVMEAVSEIEAVVGRLGEKLDLLEKVHSLFGK